LAVRVVQWATGAVGRPALQELIENPRYQLAGVLVYDPAKEGVDAGSLCGLPPSTGVRATTDKEAIVGLGADVVVHAASKAHAVDTNVEDICRLLAAGTSAATLLNFVGTTGASGLPIGQFEQVGTVNLGSTSENRALQRPDHTDFGPRLGIAWRPFGNEKTVIRTGGGVYYDQMVGQLYFQKSFNPPYFQLTQGNLLDNERAVFTAVATPPSAGGRCRADHRGSARIRAGQTRGNPDLPGFPRQDARGRSHPLSRLHGGGRGWRGWTFRPGRAGSSRPPRPSRWTLPITALRVTPPSSAAIWLADSPSAQSFFSNSTRSSVQFIVVSPMGLLARPPPL